MAELGVPRSTASGWLRGEYGPVVTTKILDMDTTQLQKEVLTLRRRFRMLAALARLLVVLLRALDVQLDRTRLPERRREEHAAPGHRPGPKCAFAPCARRALRLSPSRYHQWRRAEKACEIDDQVSCPQSTPTRLTAAEILAMKEMVESPKADSPVFIGQSARFLCDMIALCPGDPNE